MSGLPDELWSQILETGVKARGFTYKDLCCLSISCRRFHRLSNDDSFWSILLFSDFPLHRPSSSPLFPPKCLYKLQFEKDKQKKIAAHRRVVLRKESQVSEHFRKLRAFETRIAEEGQKLNATVAELSNLKKIRQVSVALNVWLPEIVRGRHKQIVEQSVMPAESRVHALEMELRLCKQQISGIRKSYEDEKMRLHKANEELRSLKYHPLQNSESILSSGNGECNTHFSAKRPKRSTKFKEAFGITSSADPISHIEEGTAVCTVVMKVLIHEGCMPAMPIGVRWWLLIC